MSLDEATVARIARLARIAVPDDELAPLATELSRILEWIEQLNEVDTEGVPPMTSVAAMKLAWREDRGDRRRPARGHPGECARASGRLFRGAQGGRMSGCALQKVIE